MEKRQLRKKRNTGQNAVRMMYKDRYDRFGKQIFDKLQTKFFRIKLVKNENMQNTHTHIERVTHLHAHNSRVKHNDAHSFWTEIMYSNDDDKISENWICARFGFWIVRGAINGFVQ